MTPLELTAWFEKRGGRPLNPDEGVRFGDPGVSSTTRRRAEGRTS